MSNELGNGKWDKNYQPSGITRAEEIALEKYPHNVYGGTLGDSLRAACMVGYHQAEKDMQIIPAEEAYTKGFSDGLKERLTWEDVKCIVEIADKILPLGGSKLEHFAFNSKYQTEQSYYEDVLRIFNETK